jgi:hypothetical protein
MPKASVYFQKIFRRNLKFNKPKILSYCFTMCQTFTLLAMKRVIMNLPRTHTVEWPSGPPRGRRYSGKWQHCGSDSPKNCFQIEDDIDPISSLIWVCKFDERPQGADFLSPSSTFSEDR